MTEKSHQDQPRPTSLESKPYQVDPSQYNSYLYQQTLPTNKEVFQWIYINLILYQEDLDHTSKNQLLYPMRQKHISQIQDLIPSLKNLHVLASPVK